MTSSSSSLGDLPGLPPLASLFVTHFDDIKGQSVAYYVSMDGVSPENIEHLTLPSGLHQLEEDLVCFTHHGRVGAGIFRSRTKEGGRRRRMGTVGVVLANATPEDVFTLRAPLRTLYTTLESHGDLFAALSPSTAVQAGTGSSPRKLLDEVWARYGAGADEKGRKPTGSDGEAGPSGTGRSEGRVRRLVDGQGKVSADHPVTYLPALLGILGPQLIPLYKAALSGKRIIIYSPPPLLPLAAFAWCIHAMSFPPSSAEASTHACSTWLGNVGLMDLVDLKTRPGGWVATTSDAIYRSHQAYDFFLDLSASPPTLHSAPIASLPNQPGPKVSYAFSDLPLYRSLVLLDSSPRVISVIPESSRGNDSDNNPNSNGEQSVSGSGSGSGTETRLAGTGTGSIHGEHDHVYSGKSIYSRPGGWWLLAFDVFSKAWELCVGVCEYAVGRGSVGVIALREAEEDAALLGDDLQGLMEEYEGDDDGHDGHYNPDNHHNHHNNPYSRDSQGGQGTDAGTGVGAERAIRKEDEAVRRGRLILRQLHHQTFHLHARLVDVVGPRSTRKQELDEGEVRALLGGRVFGGQGEGAFWRDVARVWGVTGE